MEKKEKSKKKIAKELAGVLGELEKDSQVEQMVKDNKIPFEIEGVNYRVRRPTPAEQMEVEDYRRKKYTEYVNDDSYMFRKQWIEKYAKKGINIVKMETEILTLQAEMESLELKLAQTTNPVNVDKLKKEIIGLMARQMEINIEKSDLLSCSIEDQLVVAVNSYYTYAVLEKENDKKEWVKVFDDYKTFIDSKDSKLLTKSFYYINFIIYGEPLSE